MVSAWQRHEDLLSNAGSLVGTAGVTSALGFAYWAIAARLFDQQTVGYGAAAVSAMTLLGTIGMFGLGTVLIGELARHGPRAGLVAAGLITSGVGSLVLGLGFAIVVPYFSHRFEAISGTPWRVVSFAAGVALTGATLVFDQATIGLLRGGLQLLRNLAFRPPSWRHCWRRQSFCTMNSAWASFCRGRWASRRRWCRSQSGCG